LASDMLEKLSTSSGYFSSILGSSVDVETKGDEVVEVLDVPLGGGNGGAFQLEAGGSGRSDGNNVPPLGGGNGGAFQLEAGGYDGSDGGAGLGPSRLTTTIANGRAAFTIIRLLYRDGISSSARLPLRRRTRVKRFIQPFYTIS
jgi:hypothetical protein